MPTRRWTLLGGGALAASTLLTGTSGCAQTHGFTTLLPVPPLIDARSQGSAIRLVAQEGRHEFVAGRPATTLGYSGPILGPTLRMRRGEEVRFEIENRMDATTTVHWHGLLIPSDRDGAPHDPIAPGETWRKVLPIAQAESTAWYHPHPHRDTARQVYFGLAGLVLIEDGTGAQLGLPRTYGVDDLPLILQDRLFDATDDLIYPDGPMTVMQGARGNTITANGAIAPVAHVPAGLVRLRLLNGSNARNLDLGFDDGRAFHVIASDGGYLAAPVAMTRILIAPSERFEILVDFSDGRAAHLETGPDPVAPMMGMMMGGMGRAQSPAAPIMKFAPDDRRPSMTTAVPPTLVDMPPLPPIDPLGRRRFVLNDMGMMMGGMMGGGRAGAALGINGQAFDMDRIDAEIALGSSEVWDIETGAMAHPFHVHGVHFSVISLDGAPPPVHLQGWKDTVLVARSAEILIHFTQVAPRAHPFMFHCHILEHEDAGMMGQYVCG
jgi:FtsP/CotA-like multicopper oxidase with cupredoxin domain